jgi:hypothetical protein
LIGRISKKEIRYARTNAKDEEEQRPVVDGRLQSTVYDSNDIEELREEPCLK